MSKTKVKNKPVYNNKRFKPSEYNFDMFILKFFIFLSAPPFINILATSIKSFSDAKCNAVKPSHCFKFTFAPFCINNSTHSSDLSIQPNIKESLDDSKSGESLFDLSPENLKEYRGENSHGR